MPDPTTSSGAVVSAAASTNIVVTTIAKSIESGRSRSIPVTHGSQTVTGRFCCFTGKFSAVVVGLDVLAL